MEETNTQKFRRAIEGNDLLAVKALLEAGALPDGYDYDPFTDPLVMACTLGRVEIADSLIEYKLAERYSTWSINERYESDETGLTAPLLALALRYRQEEIGRLLIEKGANPNGLYYFNQNGAGVSWWLAEDDLLNFMVSHGLDVDAQDNDELTALTLAVMNGDANRVDLLLSLGANPNQPTPQDLDDIWGWDLLSFAVYKAGTSKTNSQAYFAIIKALLQYGARLDVQVEYEGEPSSVIDVVLVQNNPELDALFGLQQVRQLPSKPKMDANDMQAVYDMIKAEADTPRFDLIRPFKIYRTPKKLIDDCAENDDEIMEDCTRVRCETHWIALDVRKIHWSGHTPLTDWIEMKRLFIDADEDDILDARQLLLRNKRYFRVCTMCTERNPLGWMHNKEVCQNCAETELGIRY